MPPSRAVTPEALSRKGEHLNAERLMERALALARRGYPAPNPRVGAVVWRDGLIVGEGHHDRRGGPHAEVSALAEAGNLAEGATLVVTLEPCCHEGGGKLTPPCCGAITKAGIRRVMVGALDPNPAVSGKGVELLRRAGLEVCVGIREAACRAAAASYFAYRSTGRPFVILKWAQSLDGFVAGPGGGGRISGPEAEAECHRLRAECGAVLVSSRTVEADDPRLTTRLVDGPDPARIALDARLRLDRRRRVFASGARRIVVCSERRASGERKPWLELGVELVEAEELGSGELSIGSVLGALGRAGVSALLVEAGPTLARSFLDSGLVDELQVTLSPLLLGGGIAGPRRVQALSPEAAGRLPLIDARRLGDDVLLRFSPVGGEGPCLPG